MDAGAWLDLLSDGGILAGCILLIWLLATEKLVPRSRLNEQRQERLEDDARSRAAMERSMVELKALTDALIVHNRKTDALTARLEGIERQLGRRVPPREPPSSPTASKPP